MKKPEAKRKTGCTAARAPVHQLDQRLPRGQPTGAHPGHRRAERELDRVGEDHGGDGCTPDHRMFLQIDGGAAALPCTRVIAFIVDG